MRVSKRGDAIPLNDSTYYMWHVFIQREGHAIDKTDGVCTIDGKPATSYTVQRDYCFGLGDNRNNSLDSRYWGFIPVDDVQGTLKWIYWSKEPDGPVRWERIFTSIE